MKRKPRAETSAPALRAPKRLRTTDDVRQLQRVMLQAVVRPLTKDDRLQPRWTDGRPMSEVAEEFIRPNDRLSSVERLELYNRMYWFRLLDCFYDDNPGLRALLGDRKFAPLAQAFLAKYPSRSFTLRNLCSRLEQFLREEPKWTTPHTLLACEIARFEWAQTVAFDGEARPVFTPAEIAARPPSRLRLGLQPYLTLLEFRHPVDDFVIAAKKRDALRNAASNAVDAPGQSARASKKLAPPRRERVWLAAHRLGNLLYYKRLEAPAYAILVALRDGQTLTRAVAAAGRGVTPEQVQGWFATWMELGWFCRRE